jgi:hypothetical protein
LKGVAISVFCFGFGEDHDSNMLREISESGNGLYYFLKNADEIPVSFANCLGGLLSVVAQNIKLTIEINEEEILNYEIEKLISKLKTTESKDIKKKIEIIIGDLYSEEKRDIIFSIKCKKIESMKLNCKFLTCTLNYFNVINTGLENEVVLPQIDRTENEIEKKIVNVELDKQKNRLISTEALEVARKQSENKKLEEGRKTLYEAIEKIKNSFTGNDNYSFCLIEDLKQCLETMQDDYQFKSVGTKLMSNYYQSNSNQRHTSYTSLSSKTYSTPKKNKMEIDSLKYMKDK